MKSCTGPQPTDILVTGSFLYRLYLHEEGDKYKALHLNRVILVTAFSLSAQMSVSATLVSALGSWSEYILVMY